MTTHRLAALCVLLALLLIGPRPSAAAPLGEADPLVVFLVRHAEKVDSSRDPALSGAGVERAKELAQMLRSEKLDGVWSSDYARTRDTAEPVARALEIETELYDPRALPALAEKLRAAGGRHLVVGHSNTTPALVELLGGDARGKIAESEYDRIYAVTIGENGDTASLLLRFGGPHDEP